jgi:hypothetical protein
MGAAPLRGEQLLPVPFAVRFAPRLRPLAMAGGTACAFFIKRGGKAFLAHRPPAGTAERMAAGRKPMPNRHPLIEHEALAAPQAFLLRHRLQIPQDPALEVEDILHAFAL